jgi:hypothetical protein
MKAWIKALICFLKILQKFPYEKVITDLEQIVSEKSERNFSYIETIKIAFQNGAVLINEAKIINSKTVVLKRIFEILLDQFIIDKKQELSSEQHAFLSVKQISKILKDFGLAITDDEKQVRWHINKLRRNFKKVVGIPEFVEIKRWSGNQSKDHGYRINPHIAICF